MRMRLSSNQVISTPMPMMPRSIVMSSAATTSAWPRSSLAARIERHHGGVTQVERPEPWDEIAKGSPTSVEIADRDAGGIRRAHVVAAAGLPVDALLDEIEPLPGDEWPTVRRVDPLVRDTGCLRPGRGRLVDADRADVRERDLRA